MLTTVCSIARKNGCYTEKPQGRITFKESTLYQHKYFLKHAAGYKTSRWVISTTEAQTPCAIWQIDM